MNVTSNKQGAAQAAANSGGSQYGSTEPQPRYMTRHFLGKMCAYSTQKERLAVQADKTETDFRETRASRKRKIAERLSASTSTELLPDEPDSSCSKPSAKKTKRYFENESSSEIKPTGSTETQTAEKKISLKRFPVLYPAFDKVDTEALSGKVEDEQTRAEKEAVGYGEGSLVIKENNMGIRGLYADRQFKKDCYITAVEGMHEIVDKKRLSEIKGDKELWSHLIMVSQNHIIHGYQEPIEKEGAGSLVNDGSLSELNPSNAEFMLMGSGEIYVKATREIQRGEEILADYGDREHWKLAKKHSPETYQSVFQRQIRTRKQIKGLVGNPSDSCSMDDALPELSLTPIPSLPEWKGKAPEQWTNPLLRYLMFKRGVAGASILNVETLRQLNPKSDEYFYAVVKYFKGIDTYNNIACFFNTLKNKISVPDNGVFSDVSKWGKRHFNYFDWKNGKVIDRGDERKRRTSILREMNSALKIVSVSHEEYCKILLSYCKYFFNQLNPGESLDLTDEESQKKLSNLRDNLCGADVPLPDCLKNNPDLPDHWTRETIIALLNKMGVEVVNIAPDKGNYAKLIKAAQEGKTEGYYDQLSIVINNNRFHYKNVYDYLKTIDAVSSACLPDDISGVQWDKEAPQAYFLALYLTGCEISEAALHGVTTRTLSRAIKLIDRKVHDKVFKDLLVHLANIYDKAPSMRLHMKKIGVSPEEGKKWGLEYWRELRSREKLYYKRIPKMPACSEGMSN